MDAIQKLNAPPAADAALREAASGMMNAALEQRTFEQLAAAQTRSCASAHEAGHAVIIAAEDPPVRDVRVFRDRREGGWSGRTLSRGPQLLTPDGGPEPYLKLARITVAGFAGELVAGFDVIGSSVDEVAAAQGPTGQASLMLDATLDELWMTHVLGPTLETLATYRAAHQRIASALMNVKRLHGSRLAALLRGIERRSA